VAVLQQRDIVMPTKTGSGKSKLPGHLRLCLILNIFLKIKNQIKSIINKSINTKKIFLLITLLTIEIMIIVQW